MTSALLIDGTMKNASLSLMCQKLKQQKKINVSIVQCIKIGVEHVVHAKKLATIENAKCIHKTQLAQKIYLPDFRTFDQLGTRL